MDIGCGDRPYESIFLAHHCEYTSCDLEGDVDVLIKPGEPIALSDSTFDGVVSFQVLEHVWDIDWYLGECCRLLKPGGWLLLTTHGTWLYHPHPTDYRRWTKDGLSMALSSRGFNVETLVPVIGPLAWTTQFRLFGYHVALEKIRIIGPMIFMPLACIMNARMILEDLVTPRRIQEDNACTYITISRK